MSMLKMTLKWAWTTFTFEKIHKKSLDNLWYKESFKFYQNIKSLYSKFICSFNKEFMRPDNIEENSLQEDDHEENDHVGFSHLPKKQNNQGQIESPSIFS